MINLQQRINSVTWLSEVDDAQHKLLLKLANAAQYLLENC